ncbi:putative 1-(5-phosphoribosyl)-5-amino-4-imidazole-carboxylate (AIR) carboxylase [Candidatus Nitrososphaera gargensis Ga9.2]|uniref:Putative 1-(5-phosphoribosyl)-5-amino-4-imidazole-carboxylate (AIR) carboxylase n=1 Tax=Nitrososphaera gargensis (strain Ga9.2) TaxID=1237085 RepID=K0I7A8_NITGG|nr:nickel pincer cofactor biosynthesis protein LarB [Candidatus Nitrososphaera gargensis]AFU57146.1 putative 1-(5-phosphoribosyl)-5-amino-4-imidazole-carboxylate (AIR) carboxylase [Candidatus Nitrososphaera gargensis Ga9.2]
MDLHTILDRFANGSLSLSDVEKEISIHAIEKIGDIAKLDVGREMRRGMPEIIFAENKEYRDIIRIALAAVRHNGQAVVSRIRKSELSKVTNALKKKGLLVEVGRNSTTLLASDKSFSRKKIMTGAKIGIMAAGTSDIGVAEEARLVAKAMGCEAIASYDVGIAGMHRLFPALKEMVAQNTGAIVVVAGMEGALASVVTSMVDVPVVGVPTSIGYGFGANGIAALASMLQSCTLGLAVVNIDNGVGAGAYAASIAKRMTRK